MTVGVMKSKITEAKTWGHSDKLVLRSRVNICRNGILHFLIQWKIISYLGRLLGVSILRIIYIEQGIVETILASQKQGAVVVAL